MARRKRRRGADEPEGEAGAPRPKPAPEKLSRPFAEALRGMKVTPPAAAKQASAAPAPPPVVRRAAPTPTAPPRAAPLGGYEYADRAAFQQAFAGVRPLDAAAGRKPRRGATPESPDRATDAAREALDARDEEARRRLDRLVAGEVRFDVVREEDGEVRGARAGAHPSHLRELAGAVAPRATLDLHGRHGADAERAIARFVREHQRAGDRVVLVVHGKGRHSDGAIGVLLDHAIHALTEGGASPWVVAFRSAPERLGGRGALVVRLSDRG